MVQRRPDKLGLNLDELGVAHFRSSAPFHDGELDEFGVLQNEGGGGGGGGGGRSSDARQVTKLQVEVAVSSAAAAAMLRRRGKSPALFVQEALDFYVDSLEELALLDQVKRSTAEAKEALDAAIGALKEAGHL